jgi:hypothetical protein
MFRTSTAPRPLLPWANPYAMTQGHGNAFDWAKVSPYYYLIGKFTVKLNGAVIAGAVSITVDPLPKDLGVGVPLNFGAAAVVTTAPVAAGGTTVPTTEFSDPVADNAEAYAGYPNNSLGRMIPAGSCICRVASGLLLPRRDRTGAEECIGFLASDAHELAVSDAKSGYGLVIGNTAIYENLCPDADPTTGDLPTAYKTELQANTLGFVFIDWEDDRVV